MPTYTLPMPLPTANLIWRHGRTRHGKPVTYRASSYTSWLQVAGMALRQQGARPVKPPVRIAVRIKGGNGFNRGRDLDNAAFKAILDLLRHAGVIAEDNVQHVTELRATYQEDRSKGAVATCSVELETIP